MLKLLVKTGQRTGALFALQEGQDVVIGSSPKSDCPVTEEKYLSRRHIRIRVAGDEIQVERLPDARNPLLYKGEKADQFTLRPGEYFVVGATSFCLVHRAGGDVISPKNPNGQFTVDLAEVRDARSRGEHLLLLDLMELPEVLRNQNRQDFFVYACGLLRRTSGASWTCVVSMHQGEPISLAEDAVDDRPQDRPLSRALLSSAISGLPQPVIYSWSPDKPGDIAATQHEGIGWAVACAVPIPGESPVVFYLAGSDDRPTGRIAAAGAPMGLRDIAKMAGFVADTIGRSLSLQKVESWQVRLERFFSKKLASTILEQDAAKTLEPKIAEATVMFFDIRGFSMRTEENLERILEFQSDLKRLMSDMTQIIFDHEGVVLQYLGDGIMACWNVPYPSDNHVESACRAAIRMVESASGGSRDWACGISIGLGKVVAGALGSEQVYSYGILGPIVNQTSRVEGITKLVGEPILVTSEVAKRLGPDFFITRRVGRFRPLGLESEVDICTIHSVPGDPAKRDELATRMKTHEQALAAFESGDWAAAETMLHPLVPVDACSKYLYKLAMQGPPPRDWKGVIELTSK
jgi:adenylate cyclase